MRRITDPGKFEGGLELTRFLYEVTLHGFSDDEVSDDEGWATLLSGPFDADSLEKLTGEKLAADEWQYLTEMAGVILSGDSNGFVYGDYYEDAEELEHDWDETAAEYSDDSL